MQILYLFDYFICKFECLIKAQKLYNKFLLLDGFLNLSENYFKSKNFDELQNYALFQFVA